MRQKQQDFFKKTSSSYGGDLLKKRKNRQHGRPISTKHSMHLVLRSTQARGPWSFNKHKPRIRAVIETFAVRYGVKLKSLANVGNHLHLHLQFTTRLTYAPFIRAITAAIMMAVTGSSRWNKIKFDKRFWDRRPFTRIITGFRALLTLQDYIHINRLEGWGYSRDEARFLVSWERAANSG